jgi:hypothetical protein
MGAPAKLRESTRGIETAAGLTIRLCRIPATFSGIASKETDFLNQVAYGDLCPGSKIHGVRLVIFFCCEKNALGGVFDIVGNVNQGKIC